MRYADALKLKKGDLVVIDNRNRSYAGLILEIESISIPANGWYYLQVTLKQPGFNGEFRIRDYDTRHVQRYEP